MRQIGRYEGRPCYEYSLEEYIESRYFNDYQNCYIIGNKFIFHNEIIGELINGMIMFYDNVISFESFYKINDFDHKDGIGEEEKRTKSVSKMNVAETATIEVLDFNFLINQINFTNYTT